jgi:hypothetical protein
LEFRSKAKADIVSAGVSLIGSSHHYFSVAASGVFTPGFLFQATLSVLFSKTQSQYFNSRETLFEEEVD